MVSQARRRERSGDGQVMADDHSSQLSVCADLAPKDERFALDLELAGLHVKLATKGVKARKFRAGKSVTRSIDSTEELPAAATRGHPAVGGRVKQARKTVAESYTLWPLASEHQRRSERVRVEKDIGERGEKGLEDDGTDARGGELKKADVHVS